MAQSAPPTYTTPTARPREIVNLYWDSSFIIMIAREFLHHDQERSHHHTSHHHEMSNRRHVKIRRRARRGAGGGGGRSSRCAADGTRGGERVRDACHQRAVGVLARESGGPCEGEPAGRALQEERVDVGLELRIVRHVCGSAHTLEACEIFRLKRLRTALQGCAHIIDHTIDDITICLALGRNRRKNL